ncbi:MAG: sigma factor-like helix-turn-helix DNA-binding protein [Kofleriaceae bacterium]
MIDHDDNQGKRRFARGSLSPTALEAGEATDQLAAADELDDEDEFEDDDEPADANVVADGELAVDGELPEVSRKVRRRRRRTRPRSKTIAMKRLTREELRQGALMYPPVDEPRPTMRAQCAEELRPCPWVACKFHLYLDVNPETGSIKINFPELEPWELPHTCSLDIAERGGITLEEVGEIMNLTRERIRQVEVRGLLKLKMASPSPEEIGAALIRRPGQ